MFDNFKERLQNVQHDLTTGLKNLTTKAKEVGKTGRRSEVPVGSPEFIAKPPLDAGAELLNKYQLEWIDLHRDIEDSAKKAIIVDNEILKQLSKFEKQVDALSQFNNQLTSLPKLSEDLQNVAISIGSLEGQFEEVEGMMTYLEDLCDEEEHIRNVQGHKNQMLAYKEIKRQEEEVLKAQLQSEYEQKVREIERNENAKMEERQKTFQDVFNRDMQHYKEHGEMNFPIRKSERSSVGSVEEVDLGDVMDSDELDAFLGPEVSAKNQPRSDDKKTKDEDDITGAIVVQEDNTELDDDSFKESPPPSVNECDDTVDDQKDCPAKETPTS